MKKVLVFGTFDGVHEGHINFLKQAKKYGSLTAIIARDLTVKRLKRRYCYNSERKRLRDVLATKLVKDARLGHLDDPYKVISEIKPDIICLGYDQKFFTSDLKEELKERGLKAKIIKLKSYKPRIYHSSLLLKKKVAC